MKEDIKIKRFILSFLFLVLLVLINLNNCSNESNDNINNELINDYKYITGKIVGFSSSSNTQEIIKEDYIFQLITNENEIKQLNDTTYKNENNISIIDLDNCTNILKEKNIIQNTLSLVIFKYENVTNLISGKNIQYEIYDPTTNKKIELTECLNTEISIYIPINISSESQSLYEDLKKNEYNYFDMNDNFYQDICTLYKTIDNTDILLSDRRKDYFIKDVAPQSNCKFSEYINNKYLQYKCKVYNEGIKPEELNRFYDENKITEFYKDLPNLSLKILKCAKLVFSSYSMTKNVGSIIIFVFIILNLIFVTIYAFKNIIPLKVYIGKIYLERPTKIKYKKEIEENTKNEEIEENEENEEEEENEEIEENAKNKEIKENQPVKENVEKKKNIEITENINVEKKKN